MEELKPPSREKEQQIEKLMNLVDDLRTPGLKGTEYVKAYSAIEEYGRSLLGQPVPDPVVVAGWQISRKRHKTKPCIEIRPPGPIASIGEMSAQWIYSSVNEHSGVEQVLYEMCDSILKERGR